MLTPIVLEIRRALEPVGRDTFVERERAAKVIAFPAPESQVRQLAA